MMSKVAEGKGKTCGKNGKNAKCAEVQDSESTERIDGQLSKLLFQAIVNVFSCIKAGTCTKERKPYF